MLNVLRFGAFVCLLVQIAVAQTVGPAPGGSGSGTVTSVATTSPITGGTITGTGTIACATCVVSGGALGTPSSGTATNLTGLPLTTGVTGLLPAANANLASWMAPRTFARMPDRTTHTLAICLPQSLRM